MRELTTHRQISCIKTLVRVSCTRNFDRLPSALDESRVEAETDSESPEYDDQSVDV